MEALRVGEATGVTPLAQPPAPLPTETVQALTPEASATPEATPADVTSPTVVTEPTQAPTASPAPTELAPSPQALPTLVLPTLAPASNEERWRARQEGREVFPELQGYSTTGSELYWFDPVNQQSVTLGVFTGGFVAQARFILRGPGVEALEVPYQLNQSYGLTALSPAILERVRAAGYGDWIETYVVVTPNVSPR